MRSAPRRTARHTRVVIRHVPRLQVAGVIFVTWLALAIGPAWAQQVLQRWDFETTDAVEFWTGQDDYETHFKGLTTEQVAGGGKCLKLDLTFKSPVYTYLNVPLSAPIMFRDRHLALRGRVYVERRTVGAVGIGYYSPASHCIVLSSHPKTDGWQDFECHLDSLKLRNDEDEYLTLAGWYLSFMGSIGRTTVYLDDVELVEQPPPEEVGAELKADAAQRRRIADGLKDRCAQIQKALAEQEPLLPPYPASRAYHTAATDALSRRLATAATRQCLPLWVKRRAQRGALDRRADRAAARHIPQDHLPSRRRDEQRPVGAEAV